MPSQRSTDPVFTVLLVCTGNICRSPLAERLGRAYLAEVMGEDSSAIRLVSAGVRAVVGSEMHPHSALALRGLGGEPEGFRATQLDDAMAAGADLTLTMTRQHRRDVLRRAPRGLARTFTLREAVALTRFLDPPGGRAETVGGSGFAERARRLVQEMAAARSLRRGSPVDDIPDPIGLPVEVHAEVGEAVAHALLPLLDRIVQLHPAKARRHGSTLG